MYKKRLFLKLKARLNNISGQEESLGKVKFSILPKYPEHKIRLPTISKINIFSPQRTDINNYRPITLISCVFKILTKILAKRISAALDNEDIVGPEQNGFRANRSCGDNLFILNTVLEFNKSKKLLSHLLFLDLKEAYDRVDRGIVLSKLPAA